MGKGRPRAVEKGVLGQSSSYAPASGSLNIPSGPVYYPTEEEFKDPLGFISKIRSQAEPYGICRIVPPESWKPPFALDLDSFTFPTKAQAIHQLQVRPASCDSDTFELEYNRFLEEHCGKKLQKRVVFEGQDLDLCKLFNAVKRYGGYDKVVKEKRWGEVFRLVSSSKKIPECAKHVLCQLYREHLYDYESFYNRLTANKARKCKKRMHEQKKSNQGFDILGCKRRRRNNGTSVTVEEKEEFDQICQQCNSGSHGEVMLLCDRCNKGWHMYCLSPPLNQIPPGNWYCSECMGSDKESFGFVPGKCFSLETFRRVANRTRRKWLGSALVSRVQIEKRFWEIVEGLVGEVEVMYGSDLDTSVYGSGFPRVNVERPESIEAAVWDRYCTSPWNLNNLPKLQGSMLRAVHHNIAGVMVPWLYIGMLFSSFCWHFEDHCFYSMNYLHWGEPKCWYSVPGSEANAFEEVMRASLPDLFDAQPDLLFQLVTMLNPSVLQKNDVPVYSVLQEPGNFVITFPRSYHGGFNLGINCAEAVNFAPADWLPHGGFGAGLYQLYRKAAVLSHEELLCVVAKNECNSNVSPHLKKELLRVYAKEKSWREQLWKNGFESSSPMSLRKNADQVGTEEDPPCIICHQYLYLSAVVCCCRPDAFACLEHWTHICECEPSKHRLLYRYTLAELSDLVHLTDKYDFEETPQNRSLRRQHSCSNDSTGLTKKVKYGTVSHAQLAKEWISHSCKIVKMPFSSDTFADALKEAEQFIWAGAEMDPVRDMAARLIKAKKWAEGVKDCVSKVESWSCKQCSDSEKVPFERVNQLLSLNPVPCNEPLYLKLKNYVEEARLLIGEINSAVSSCSEIFELEKLHSRACDLPFSLEESKKLGQRISSAKVCLDRVRACIHDGCSTTIELDILYELKAELLVLQVQLPETEMLLNLLRQTELHRTRCCEILKDPISLKEVEALFQDLDDFKINFAELKLLRQYFSDVVSWKTRFHDIIMNASERHDQGKVVDELKCIFNDGATLKIQVDELHLVEVELRRAACREKALKIRDACGCKMSLELFRDLMMEADKLEIKGEKLFVDVSGVLAVAMRWEENAKHVLGSKAQMSVLEEMIRAGEGICVILPSFNEVNDAVSTAKSWLEMSKPFLASVSSTGPSTGSLLKIEELEELILQSKSLKVSLDEQNMVQTVMQNCLDWKSSAFSLLEDAESLFDLNDIDHEVANGLSSKIELLCASLIPMLDTGVSLGFNFIEIPRLQNFRSSLNWSHKALSFRCVSPSLEEVEELIVAAEDLPLPCTSSSLLNSFMDGIRWLRRASLIVSVPCSFRRCQLADAEEVSRDSQALKIKFPTMADLLVHAIKRHKLWLEQVDFFFCLKHGDRSCSSLIELKDNGKADAFDCPELSLVLSEVEKLEKWKLHFEAVMGPFVGDRNLWPIALAKVRDTSDRCLSIYEKSKEKKVQNVCICRSPEFDQQEFLTCLSCMSCYHLRCLGSIFSVTNDRKENTCQYCRFLKSGSIPRNGRWPLKPKGNRPELKMIVELISGAENVCVRLEEQEILQKLVAQALALTTCLMEIVEVALAYLDKDIGIVCKQLSNALQAVNMAGVYDHEAYFGLELALTRNSWKVRVHKLLEGLQKPSIQQIQKLFKEGEAINMPPEDHFRKRIAEVKSVCTQWALTAKQVATDSGELELDKVFKLIKEGENLPVHFEKELKLLRARSMLYCICRKPYDQRAMIACDRCDEWYHFDCIKLSSAPKIYICPACWPLAGDELSSLPLENEDRSTDAKCGDLQIPCGGVRRMVKSSESRPAENHTNGVLNCSNGIHNLLLWRNRKPFRRAAKKRVELETFSSFLRIQH